MKKDHTAAKTKAVKGSVKEAIGKIAGDPKIELRGSLERADGEKQIMNEKTEKKREP